MFKVMIDFLGGKRRINPLIHIEPRFRYVLLCTKNPTVDGSQYPANHLGWC